jgi:hypothetical protein
MEHILMTGIIPYNIVFKIKHILHTASGSTIGNPPTLPQIKTLCAHLICIIQFTIYLQNYQRNYKIFISTYHN